MTGIAKRVKTGEKQRFHGLEPIGPLIERMMKATFESKAIEARTGP